MTAKQALGWHTASDGSDYVTLTDGSGNLFSGDTAAGLYVVNRASSTGMYSFQNITTNTTTVVKSGSGTLHSIVVNASGVTGTITIYDNTAASVTKIGTANSAISAGISLIYDIAFNTGLTVVTTGLTPSDITVTYK